MPARLQLRADDGVFAFLDESEAILEGRRLAPHWRFARGVSVKAFFEEPQTFDLVLFVSRGALPYLAEGPITSPERWGADHSRFRGQFLPVRNLVN